MIDGHIAQIPPEPLGHTITHKEGDFLDALVPRVHLAGGEHTRHLLPTAPKGFIWRYFRSYSDGTRQGTTDRFQLVRQGNAQDNLKRFSQLTTADKASVILPKGDAALPRALVEIDTVLIEKTPARVQLFLKKSKTKRFRSKVGNTPFAAKYGAIVYVAKIGSQAIGYLISLGTNAVTPGNITTANEPRSFVAFCKDGQELGKDYAPGHPRVGC